MPSFPAIDYQLYQMHQPYHSDSINTIYNLLFCDLVDLFHAGNSTNTYPWDILCSPEASIMDLLLVAKDGALESRMRLLAWHRLQEIHYSNTEKYLLGVIIEVGMPEGLDTLAAYRDGSARYINHTEKLLLWDARTNESDGLISDLFSVSMHVVNQIGPWKDQRRPPPADGMVRLSFLASDGLYFGEGPFDILSADAMGGPVIQAGTQLMMYLTTHATPPAASS